MMSPRPDLFLMDLPSNFTDHDILIALMTQQDNMTTLLANVPNVLVALDGRVTRAEQDIKSLQEHGSRPLNEIGRVLQSLTDGQSDVKGNIRLIQWVGGIGLTAIISGVLAHIFGFG